MKAVTTSSIYCSKCRADFAHHIAQGKFDPDKFRNVEVLAPLQNGLYECRCRDCGHRWKSKSPEAALLVTSRILG